MMPSMDVYSRDGDELSENWIILDLVYWLKDQGLDVFKRTNEILNPDWIWDINVQNYIMLQNTWVSEIVMNINLVQLSFHNIPIKRFNFIKSDFDYFIKSSSAMSPPKIDRPIDPFRTNRTHQQLLGLSSSFNDVCEILNSSNCWICIFLIWQVWIHCDTKMI